MKGYFFTFEGIDGTGKTTQVELLQKFLTQKGYDVIKTREPGGSSIGPEIRSILLNNREKKLSPYAEVFLFMADRLQHIEEVIQPALDLKKIVLCDRYIDSTLAYQGGGRQSDLAGFEAFIRSFILQPDKTFLLNLSYEKAMQRLHVRDTVSQQINHIDQESASFFENVILKYQNLRESNRNRFVLIDADGSIEEVHNLIEQNVRKIIAI